MEQVGLQPCLPGKGSYCLGSDTVQTRQILQGEGQVGGAGKGEVGGGGRKRNTRMLHSLYCDRQSTNRVLLEPSSIM